MVDIDLPQQRDISCSGAFSVVVNLANSSLLRFSYTDIVAHTLSLSSPLFRTILKSRWLHRRTDWQKDWSWSRLGKFCPESKKSKSQFTV